MCQLPGEGRAEWWVSQGLYILRKEESRSGGSHRPVSETGRALQGFIHTQRAGRGRGWLAPGQPTQRCFLLNILQVLWLTKC